MTQWTHNVVSAWNQCWLGFRYVESTLIRCCVGVVCQLGCTTCPHIQILDSTLLFMNSLTTFFFCVKMFTVIYRTLKHAVVQGDHSAYTCSTLTKGTLELFLFPLYRWETCYRLSVVFSYIYIMRTPISTDEFS